jgi:hypothetical protein
MYATFCAHVILDLVAIILLCKVNHFDSLHYTVVLAI